MFWIIWRWEIWYFWAKKLMEIWYLIFTDYWKVLVLNFSLMGNTISFLSQEVDGNIIFTGYWEVLVLNFSVIRNTVFFQPKSWWKDDIYMIFLSFLWYSRTWKIWFFSHWILHMNTFTLKQIMNLFSFCPTLKTRETGVDLTVMDKKIE